MLFRPSTAREETMDGQKMGAQPWEREREKEREQLILNRRKTCVGGRARVNGPDVFILASSPLPFRPNLFPCILCNAAPATASCINSATPSSQPSCKREINFPSVPSRVCVNRLRSRHEEERGAKRRCKKVAKEIACTSFVPWDGTSSCLTRFLSSPPSRNHRI